MTDAELIARLRDGCNLQQRDGKRAADRIEALTKERDALIEWNGQASVRAERAEDRAEAAEAKLAKAEAGLREIAGECGCFIARTTLAEIKGGNDAESNL